MKNQKGISGLKLVVLVLVGTIGLIIWLWVSQGGKNISSYDECVAAGNPIMESYPEQCIANGTTFVNPRQQ